FAPPVAGLSFLLAVTTTRAPVGRTPLRERGPAIGLPVRNKDADIRGPALARTVEDTPLPWRGSTLAGSWAGLADAQGVRSALRPEKASKRFRQSSPWVLGAVGPGCPRGGDHAFPRGGGGNRDPALFGELPLQ